ncbi:hypothetical protein niasHT_011023 [Heterodera trifolii]|uniref:RecQ-mediated genome instability protein 1 n=1 Tax=Heterodera trifolii TaxID=157864 RepID=A0ABD2L954_9BILA
MVENISMVEQYFVERHIKLKRDWLLEALKFVTAANPQIHLVDSIYQQWLFTDLKESTEPINGLSKLIDGPSFQEPYIFQIRSLSDIGTSNWKQSKRLADPLYEEPTEFDQPNPFSGLCCFSLRLSDGVVELKAFEKKRVPDLPTMACPGSKILIYGKVELCRGYLFLTKENCQLLGGQKPTQCVPMVPFRQMSEQRNASGSSLIGEGPNCFDTTERQKPESRSIGEGPNCFDTTGRQKPGSRSIGEGPNCFDTTERQKPESRSIGEGPNCFDTTGRQKPGSRSIGEGPNCFDTTGRQKPGSRSIGEGPNCFDTTGRQKPGSRSIGEGPNCFDTTERQKPESRSIGEGPNCFDTTERQKPESRSIGEGPNCFDTTERQKPESRSIGEGPNCFDTTERLGEGPNCFDTTERQNWQPKRAKPNNDSDNSKNNNGGEWQRKMASASSFKPDGPTHEEDDSELFGRRVSKFLRSLSSTRRRRQACIGIEQLMMDFDEEEERNANGTAN